MKIKSFSFRCLSLECKIHWILRIASGLCFIGHGAFGIITKSGWLPYFEVARIGPDLAYTLMPLIGIMDIFIGILVLLRPMQGPLLFMVVWAVWTAMLRPLAGQGVWEFFERAGNYGVPLALLLTDSVQLSFKNIFKRVNQVTFSDNVKMRLIWILRLTTALLLIGHGGFGAFMQKSMLINHFGAVGIPGSGIDPVLFITLTGWFEILLGVSVLVKPLRPLLIFIVLWKLGTELLYPVWGAPIWEFVERFGSYAAPLALFYLIGNAKTLKKKD